MSNTWWWAVAFAVLLTAGLMLFGWLLSRWAWAPAARLEPDPTPWLTGPEVLTRTILFLLEVKGDLRNEEIEPLIGALRDRPVPPCPAATLSQIYQARDTLRGDG